MFENFWWVFVVVGIVLIIFEIFTPGFVIMWFGIAALVTAIPAYLNAPTWSIVLTYAVSLFVLTIYGRRITLKLFSKSSSNLKTNSNSIIGKKGFVVEDIDEMNSSGRVRVDNELWTAVSMKNEIIKKDTRIIVKEINGVKLVVEKES